MIDENQNGLINRPTFNEKTISEKYSFQNVESDNILKSISHYLKKSYTPSKKCLIRYFENRLPIVQWIRSYHVKDNLLNDIIGGLTIGVVHIPQSNFIFKYFALFKCIKRKIIKQVWDIP